jgi:Cu/Ag efflux pump CusA
VSIHRTPTARYGVNVSDTQEMIETTYGSKQLSEMLVGQERFPIEDSTARQHPQRS